jgi:hypothetical protein
MTYWTAHKKKSISLPFLFLLVGSMLSTTNCVRRVPYQKEIESPAQLLAEEQDREKIIRKALEIEKIKPKPVYRQRIILKHPQTGEDVAYTLDCSGFVSAVFKSADVGSFDVLTSNIKGENGIKIIYKALERSKKIYRKKIPNFADIIFFDNTYDSNKNGKVDDELTHEGIVLLVDDNGTITFIHSSVSGGVTRDFMNLYHPNEKTLNGVPINSHVRVQRDTDPQGTKYLAGELFHAFGTVFNVPRRKDDF